MSNARVPDLTLLLSHPAHFLALGFGAGLAKKAPGTFGSMVGVAAYWMISAWNIDLQLTIIAAMLLIGIYVCAKTGQALGVDDHGSIVWDEIVAMMLVLTITPFQWQWWIIAFLLFRLFDIWKPSPIRNCDARIKGGLGVMLDDILAAVYAMIMLKGLLWLTNLT